MGIFGNLFGGGNDDDDDDDNQPFVPGPGFFNVSQEPKDIDLLAYDDDSAVWKQDDGTIVITGPIDNEGDD
jgi:hypothetical protein